MGLPGVSAPVQPNGGGEPPDLTASLRRARDLLVGEMSGDLTTMARSIDDRDAARVRGVPMSGHRQSGRFPKEGIHMLNHAFLSVLSRAQVSARREEGQALVEYALILFLIAVVCIAVLTTLGTSVRDTLQSIADAM